MAYPNSLPPPPPPPQQTLGSSNTVYNTQIRFDPSYIKSLPGILKVVVILLCLVAFVCVVSSAFRANGRGVFFYIVCVGALCWSGALLALYALHAVERFHKLRWLHVELIASVVLVFLLLLASSICVAFGSAAYSAGGFFGYLAMMVYGADAFLKYRALMAGDLAQGQRVLTKQAHTATTANLP